MREPVVGGKAHLLACKILGDDYYYRHEEDQEGFDRSLLRLARHVASWSKDPSTQTGAVLVKASPHRPGMGTAFAVGYNGFARGVGDDPARYLDRDVKYEMVVHCEVNAVVLASTHEDPRGCYWAEYLKGSTLYTTPFMSCSRCAAVMIQAGVKRAVAPAIDPDRAARWGKNLELSRTQFREAGVELVELEGCL